MLLQVLPFVIAALTSATTVTIPVIDGASHAALQERIANAINSPSAKLCKFYGPDTKAIEKLMKADLIQCKSILYVNQQADPSLEFSLARYERINPSLGELSMRPALSNFSPVPNADEMARIMGRAEFQFSLAKNEGHDCVVVNVDGESVVTVPKTYFSIYEGLSKIYPEVSKILFNAQQPASSQFLDRLPCNDTKLCFLTKAKKDAEEAEILLAATEKVVNDKIATQQLNTIRELKQQLTIEENIEIASQQKAKDKEIRVLQQQLVDREKARELNALQRLVDLQEDLRERELRNILWYKNRKIERKRHELKMRQLLKGKEFRNIDAEIQKEIVHLKEYIRLMGTLKNKEKRSNKETVHNEIDKIYDL